MTGIPYVYHLIVIRGDIVKQTENQRKIINYLDKFERLISGENYPELEYIAECFMCAVRDIIANVNQEAKEEILIRCADSMGITVQKKDGILELTLPMILPTKAKAKAEFLFEPLFFTMLFEMRRGFHK